MNLNPPKTDAGNDQPRAIRQHAREIATSVQQFGTIIRGHDARIGGLETRNEWVLSVADFGAAPNTGADQTAAIQAALDAAAVNVYIEYYGPGRRSVYLPPGQYFHTGLDVAPRVKFFGDGPGNCQLVLKSGSNRSSIRVMAENASQPGQRYDYDHCRIEGMTIQGNSTVQTAGHGIEFVDPGYSSPYCVAGYISYVNILAAKECGIYGAPNRNWGVFDKVTVRSCGEDGIFIEGYDWRGSNFDIGASGSHGLTYSAGAHSFNNFAIYSNQGAGLFAYGRSWAALANGTFGANRQQGVIIGNIDGLPVHFTNVRIAGSGASVSNTFAAIRIVGDRSAIFTNCHIVAQGTTKAKWVVEHVVTPTTPVYFFGCYIPGADDTVQIPWATAQFSHPEWIYGQVATDQGAGVHGARIGVAGAALGELRGNGNQPVLKWQGRAGSDGYMVAINGNSGSAINPRIQVLSSADDAGFDLFAKGTGYIRLRSGAGIAFAATSPASSVNFVKAIGAVTGADAVLAVEGDTDANLRITASGAGQVRVKLPGPYANDAAAAAGGLSVGDAYRVTGGAIAWRQT